MRKINKIIIIITIMFIFFYMVIILNTNKENLTLCNIKDYKNYHLIRNKNFYFQLNYPYYNNNYYDNHYYDIHNNLLFN